ncbi:MAG: patatin-like phospholipase family protein [Chloroflexi bacterium]|nr:patatin-like phospholipase family protein [Chloroflexota bacterium]MYE39808.1 patatin-like phospholipase family protein [Chloroflexota bacterium]
MASTSSQKPTRRSDTILQTRREPLPWPEDAAFKILSIDGGGIKGIFPAGILAELEEKCLGGGHVGDYFDLLTGTSTGGIIALGLGVGLTARSLLDLYLHEGHRVFPPRQRARSRGIFRRFFRNRYDRSDLDELLQEVLASKTLRDSKYRLLIPATEAKHGDPCVFKTPHHPGYFLDGDKPMWEVAAATSAAPTYLKPVIQDGYILLDGGIWANNPTLMGLVEALTCFTVPREQISILSIGCGQNGFRITEKQTAGAGQFQWREIIYVAMHYQSLTAVNQAGLLLGRDKVVRMDRPEGGEPIDLDDWEKARQLLPGEAVQVATQHMDRVATTFFAERATPLTALA